MYKKYLENMVQRTIEEYYKSKGFTVMTRKIEKMEFNKALDMMRFRATVAYWEKDNFDTMERLEDINGFISITGRVFYNNEWMN